MPSRKIMAAPKGGPMIDRASLEAVQEYQKY
jgi:hypothetical protein